MSYDGAIRDFGAKNSIVGPYRDMNQVVTGFSTPAQTVHPDRFDKLVWETRLTQLESRIAALEAAKPAPLKYPEIEPDRLEKP